MSLLKIAALFGAGYALCHYMNKEVYPTTRFGQSAYAFNVFAKEHTNHLKEGSQGFFRSTKQHLGLALCLSGLFFLCHLVGYASSATPASSSATLPEENNRKQKTFEKE
jgi:hypothetical protein